MMEKNIANRINAILPNHHIRGINRVSTKPGSSVYRIRIFYKFLEHRDLYAKEYPECLSSNIHEVMGLDYKHLLLPRILDYHDNILISEGAPGDTLTRALLRSVLSWDRRNLLECSRKIGQAIGTLQNMTPRGIQKTGDLDLYFIREIESKEYFKRILSKDLLKNIIAQVEELKGLKIHVAQYHGDPSPHNIIMKNNQVSLIDYSFQDNATFVDPSLYIVSLELMQFRLGLPTRNIISEMGHHFLSSYFNVTGESWEHHTWLLIKKLNYLHFLLMYSSRERNPLKTLVSTIDKIYLMKQIKEN